MNFYRKYTAKPDSVLRILHTFGSDNHLRFRKNLLERMYKLIMAINCKIRDEKLQYDINRETANISALS